MAQDTSFSASLDAGLSGATRVYFIVGDPIAQVRSPSGVTAALRAAGRDAIVILAHVAPEDLGAFFRGHRAAAQLRRRDRHRPAQVQRDRILPFADR